MDEAVDLGEDLEVEDEQSKHGDDTSRGLRI